MVYIPSSALTFDNEGFIVRKSVGNGEIQRIVSQSFCERWMNHSYYIGIEGNPGERKMYETLRMSL